MQRFEMIGRLGNELDLRITKTNKKVIEFSLAISEKVNNESITTWVNCVAWEKKAETLVQYLRKGDLIFIEGKLRVQKYNDNNNQERTKTFVLVENFTLLPNARKEEPQGVAKNWQSGPDLENLGNEMKKLEFY